VLGEHAQQKGSLVGPDTLRFDFTHNEALEREEMERIEDLVNAKILENAPVVTDVLAIDEARDRGAVAIFEEKYGDVVRMLTMTADSVELCGGTHCRALGDIGVFKIVSEGGTAAGVRRIFAATGENALRYLRQLEHDLDRARRAAKAQGSDLAAKIEKIVAHERELERRVKQLEKQLVEGGAEGTVEDRLAAAQTIGGVKVLHVDAGKGTQAATLREIGEKLRDKLGPSSVVLTGSINEKGDKASLALMVSKDVSDRLPAGKLIKQIAGHIGGSGGGRPDMAQAGGSHVEGYDAAMQAVYDAVRGSLAS
jgi:alanyl-tRNA synthetase